MERVLKTGPVKEPITLVQTKSFLRIEKDDLEVEDALIGSLITAAKDWVEIDLGRALITQTWYLYLNNFPLKNYIEFPFGTLQSITAFKYTDTDGDTNTFASSNYTADIKSYIPKMQLDYGKSWPSTSLQINNPIEIEIVVGYGLTASNVPSDIKTAMLQLVSHWYINRELMIDPEAREVMEIPLLTKSLLAKYKFIKI